MQHSLGLRSVYAKEMTLTNYTEGFKGIIDYIWYTTESLAATAILGGVDTVSPRCK